VGLAVAYHRDMGALYQALANFKHRTSDPMLIMVNPPRAFHVDECHAVM
jgi:hypothetical protein